MFDCAELTGIVEEYAAFGDHHTGSDVDRETTAWLGELVRALGAWPSHEHYEFERFVCRATLRLDGTDVPSLPVFYSAIGRHRFDNVEVVRAPFAVCGSARGLDDHLAARSGAVAVAVEGPDDLVVQCNRVPGRLSSAPAVVVPGNWAERLRSGTELEFEARLEGSSSSNLVARLGADNAPPITITTPLTGWTSAAGERGTGLAVALAMAESLATDHRVTLIACSGHELDHLGLRHHLSARKSDSARVVHLGASIGAVETDADGTAVLGSQRYALTNASDDLRASIADRVLDAKWTMLDVDPWPGEGETWRASGAIVLSFVGQFPYFHTAADVPDRATTPSALELAAAVAIDAAHRFAAIR